MCKEIQPQKRTPYKFRACFFKGTGKNKCRGLWCGSRPCNNFRSSPAVCIFPPRALRLGLPAISTELLFVCFLFVFFQGGCSKLIECELNFKINWPTKNKRELNIYIYIYLSTQGFTHGLKKNINFVWSQNVRTCKEKHTTTKAKPVEEETDAVPPKPPAPAASSFVNYLRSVCVAPISPLNTGLSYRSAPGSAEKASAGVRLIRNAFSKKRKIKCTHTMLHEYHPHARIWFYSHPRNVQGCVIFSAQKRFLFWFCFVVLLLYLF